MLGERNVNEKMLNIAETFLLECTDTQWTITANFSLLDQ